jgi:hypothetical protein
MGRAGLKESTMALKHSERTSFGRLAANGNTRAIEARLAGLALDSLRELEHWWLQFYTDEDPTSQLIRRELASRCEECKGDGDGGHRKWCSEVYDDVRVEADPDPEGMERWRN